MTTLFFVLLLFVAVGSFVAWLFIRSGSLRTFETPSVFQSRPHYCYGVQESARRRRQIERGTLNRSNGVWK